MTTTTETELPLTLDSARSVRWSRVLLGFLVGIGLALLVAVGGVLAYEQAHAGKIGAGVHAGSVDVAGLTRDQAIAKVTAAYASVGAGQVALTLPDGTTQVSYADLGRHVDAAAMVDAALAVGRSGNPLARVADEIQTALHGTTIAPVVTFDTTALNASLTKVAASLAKSAVNASVVHSPAAGFAATQSSDGRSLSVDAVARQVMLALGSSGAPAQTTIDLTADLTVVAPAVSTAQASQAAAAGNAEVAPIVLTHDTDSWTIPAATVASWLSVGLAPDGSPVIQADATKVSASLTALAKTINRKAVDASFLFSKHNKVVGVVAGKDGRSLDVAGSVALVQGLLTQRAAGVASTAPLTPAVATTAPNLSTAAATSAAPQMRQISTWTTHYIVGAHNGDSANITIPAMAINGTVVAPGAVFNFWKTVGVVSLAKGYKLGGAIINGHSVEGKTIGGGICSTSTTLFNAALRAGLETGARANHYYYITRYPLGLDATVWQDGSAVQNMTFTNNTPYPILIRAYAVPGLVRFTLYSVPTGRTVSISKPIVKNFQHGYTVVEHTKALRPGQFYYSEYQADGQDVWVTVTVRDKAGKVISKKTYYSHYARMIGVLVKGVA
ncbi:MAG TPA: VanW family protein [Candidatus Limnocylindrales bacterium]|nr:VanW family protein [Candidatus Limnocylindrales bacterium]